jgi:hypothetical protein
MEDSGDLLKKYADSKRKYFDLPEGQEVKVKFLGAEVVPNHFDGGKTTCIRYHLEVDGIQKSWDRVSAELARQMSTVLKGDSIFISRTGYKNQTKYVIRKEAK